MFTYFKSAFKNAKPQLLITLIYALIAFAVIAVVYLLANFQLAKYVQTIAIYSQFGQKPPVDAYLKVIAVLLIAAVVSLFVLVQIYSNDYRSFTSDIITIQIIFSSIRNDYEFSTIIICR